MAILSGYGVAAEIGEADTREAIRRARETGEPAHIVALLLEARTKGADYEDGVHRALAIAAMGLPAESDAPA
ncbi:hypothetical protein KTR66_03680 [Roseococcus sp. SDR]|uniref:hypothetical protein n=1 Tax=Roseococcus sp. SDR TaxID=2835532 RepID=UPI001BD0C4D9|nr:hypothetical protein [Roseococcus sp. SDR]MBS7789080.1 hypothetical protein [Roseococcus sp. SDR]MBV1844394.1 hypothetical protein [Roseococcus sp. SDR]